MRRHLPPDEGRSAGFTGLVKALRTYDETKGKTLAEWADQCCVNAIRHEAERQSRRTIHSLQGDVVDPASIRSDEVPGEAYLDEILERLEDPNDVAILLAYRDSGSYTGAAELLGMDRKTYTRKFRKIAANLRGGDRRDPPRS